MDAPDPFIRQLLDWAWALIAVLGGIVWKMLHGRIAATELAMDKLGLRMDEQHRLFMERIDEFSDDSRQDRHEIRDSLQAALNTQAVTNLTVASELGKLAGKVNSYPP